jgi:ATP-binding protein involved in chromosome partitioning
MADEQSELDALILGALRKVVEPTGKNIIDAGLVVSIHGEGENDLAVVCRSPGWPDPISQRLTRDIVGALRSALPQLEQVRVEWQSGAAQEGNGKTHAPEPAAPKIKHIVAVGSGKGGVGKSTIAASLAYALKARGHCVGLMDSDVYGPSIPHMLGIRESAQVVNEPALRILPPERDGIKVISMGFLVPADKAVVWRGPMLHKAVKDFLYAVAWGELDFLIVDLPPGTGDILLSLSQQMPISGGVIVCTPQDVALLDARKALDMMRTVGIPCRGVVENMSFFNCPKCGHRSDIFGTGGARKWAEAQGVPFLGAVPINLQMRINGDDGNLRDNLASDAPCRTNLFDVADALLAELAKEPIPTGPAVEIVE